MSPIRNDIKFISYPLHHHHRPRHARESNPQHSLGRGTSQLQQADSNSNISTHARTMPVANTDADMTRSSNIIKPDTIQTPQSPNMISCRTIDQLAGTQHRSPKLSNHVPLPEHYTNQLTDSMHSPFDHPTTVATRRSHSVEHTHAHLIQQTPSAHYTRTDRTRLRLPEDDRPRAAQHQQLEPGHRRASRVIEGGNLSKANMWLSSFESARAVFGPISDGSLPGNLFCATQHIAKTL